ncbi:MAG: glutathione S-transferase family protein [Pseudomonadota bacterium]
MPDLTLIIGNKNYSSWSLRPWLFMRHFGLDFTERRVALFTDTTERELAPWFSDGKVPILLDGDLVVWDSLAILEYLSERHLNGRGWPTDSGARAMARAISAEMHSSFGQVRSELPMNCRRRFRDVPLSAAALREIERVKAIWCRCRTDHGRDGDWLCGQFSIADAMYAPVALRFFGYTVALDGIAAAYVDTVLADPHVRAWMAAGETEAEVIAEDELDHPSYRSGD